MVVRTYKMKFLYKIFKQIFDDTCSWHIGGDTLKEWMEEREKKLEEKLKVSEVPDRFEKSEDENS